jgi:biopolymer transport protein ExbD
MADKDIDLKKIKELIDIMKQNGLEEIEIKTATIRFSLREVSLNRLQGR